MFYHREALSQPQTKVMSHMLAGNNVGLATTRSIGIGRGFEHVLCTQNIIGHHTVSLKEVNYLFPLYLYPTPGEPTYHRSDAIEAARKAIRAREGLSAREQAEQLNNIADLIRRLYPREEYARWPNLAPGFLAEVEEKTGLRYAPEGGLGEGTFTPEDIFHYMYAVLHSPTYRSRYAPFLKSDFPRVPLTSDPSLFRDLAALGARLVDLHLLRADAETLHAPSQPTVSFPVQGTNEVEKVVYNEAEEKVFINKTQHFTHVPARVGSSTSAATRCARSGSRTARGAG